MRQDSPTPRSEHYHGTVCSFADYDNDGFMDVTFPGKEMFCTEMSMAHLWT